MIKIENTDVHGFGAAFRGMRNPKNSWDKSDSPYVIAHPIIDPVLKLDVPVLGPNDLKLAQTLVNAGDDHGKFMRMITVTCDITGPLYWWKEASTYSVGTVMDSCSTMHKIHAKEFTIDDFSHEHLTEEIVQVSWDDQEYTDAALDHLYDTVGILNAYREKYLETKNKDYWWQMIQLLPSSYNQRRTWMGNYQVLKRIYFARKDHKLDEWHTFCDWIKTLPYAKELMGINNV